MALYLNIAFSKDYKTELRKIDKKKNVTNATLTKVPFEIEKWQLVFKSKHPNGIPLPISNDPTQWLFHGHPSEAQDGTTLHVGLARLCGYRWPSETDSEMFLSDEARAWIAKAGALPAGDIDGLIGVPAVAGEKPLADRLRAYLAAAFGADWSDALERRLVAEADETLDKKTAATARSKHGCATAPSASTAPCSASARSSGTSRMG